MTTLMKKAIQKLKSLPDEKQDLYAQEILKTLDGDARWEELYADPRSEVALAKMAEGVRKDIKEGKVLSGDEFLAQIQNDV